MESLSASQRAVVEELVRELSRVPGVAAVALGGSHARGRARPGSDVDLGLYYAETAPFDVEALRAVCARFTEVGAPVVTDFGEWGPWVDGGAWLTVRGERVDLLYRSLDQVARVWEDACSGRFEHHFGQQAPYGYFGPTLLGELHVCRPLLDPRGVLESWKERVALYPEALRRAVVCELLWQVEFNLAAFALKLAERGDAYGVAGCLTRAAHHLVLVLFAWNRCYPLNDKTALEEIAEMPGAPERFGPRLRAVLAAVGAERVAQEASVAAMAQLFGETAQLVAGVYTPKYRPPG